MQKNSVDRNHQTSCGQVSFLAIVVACILLTFSLSASTPLLGPQALAADGTEDNSVVFYAMGDVPYVKAEDKLLPQQIAKLPADAQFLVHLGDIKDGTTPCEETIYQKVAGMLSKSKVPTFIIPGDNEWNDCQKPDQGWKYWQKHFRRFDQRWQHNFQLSRSKKHDENFVFVHRQVLFVGLNLVGGRVHDPQEWKSRHRDNLEWTTAAIKEHGKQVHAMVIFAHANPQPNHDDFFTPLVAAAQQFAKPILYLHGDGHHWIKDQPWEAKNILRVQVDQGGKAPPLKITIQKNPAEPFQFDRRK